MSCSPAARVFNKPSDTDATSCQDHGPALSAATGSSKTSTGVQDASTARAAADSYSSCVGKVVEVTYLDHFELAPEDAERRSWKLKTLGRIVEESKEYIYLVNEWSGGDGWLKPNLVAILKTAITDIKVIS